MPTGDIPPPSQHPDEEPLVCIPVNRQWIPILLGVIKPMKYPEYWAGTLDENRTARKDFGILSDQIMKGLECDMATICCLPPTIINRVNVDTGNVEVSIDNGETWQPSPDTVQSKIIAPIPPVTSGTSATKCDAATNAMAQIEGWIAHVETAFDVAAGVLDFAILVASAILDAILLLLSEGALTAAEAQIIAIITGVLTAVWEGGKSLFSDYWSPDTKDIVLCALFHHIGDDGSWNDTQFAAYYAECSAEMPAGFAKMLFLGFMSSVGKQGLNAMSATGATADADCTGCEEGCASSFTTTFGTEIDRTSSTITVVGVNEGDGQFVAQISSGDNAVCCHVTWDNTFFANWAYKDCGSDTLIVNSGAGGDLPNTWFVQKNELGPHTVVFTIVPTTP